MVVDTTLYDRLTIAHDATSDDIKRSYRRAALKWHPDRNKDNPAAAEKFKECAQAYEILSDPQQRAIYDEAGLDGVLRGAGLGSQPVYTTRTYGQSVYSQGADNIREPYQRPGRRGSSFRFQASWSFDFGGGGGNWGSYHTSSSNGGFEDFWGGGGIGHPSRVTRLFDAMRERMFSQVGSLWDGDEAFLSSRWDNNGGARGHPR